MIEFSKYHSFCCHLPLHVLTRFLRLRTVPSYRQNWHARAAALRPWTAQLLDILGIDSDTILQVRLPSVTPPAPSLTLTSRRLLSVVPPENSHLISRKMPDLSLIRTPSQDSEEGVQRIKRKKSNKGWAGEMTDPSVAVAPQSIMDGEPLFLLRGSRCHSTEWGRRTKHIYAYDRDYRQPGR
jgi:hypothetical protein